MLLCIATGCERGPAPMTTVVDSAGVRITMTRDSQVTPAQVDVIPALSLGGPDAFVPNQFFRVQNVVFGPDGRLWPSELPVPRAFDVYADGAILAQQPRILHAGFNEAGRLIRDSTQLVRVDFARRTPEAAAPARRSMRGSTSSHQRASPTGERCQRGRWFATLQTIYVSHLATLRLVLEGLR